MVTPSRKFLQNSHSNLYYYFLNDLFIYFIFGCTGSSLLHMGFLYLQQVGACLHCGAAAFHCSGFSCGAWAAGHTGFSRCSTWAQLWPTGLVALWHVESSQTRIEPMSSVLAGRFLSTVPAGKSSKASFCRAFLQLTKSALWSRSFWKCCSPCPH